MNEGFLSVKSPLRNEALCKYHKQMFEKNILALTEQAPDVRFTGTMNVSLTEKQLKIAHSIMDEAMNKMRALTMQKDKGKKVYHTSFNVFQISNNLQTKRTKK